VKHHPGSICKSSVRARPIFLGVIFATLTMLLLPPAGAAEGGTTVAGSQYVPVEPYILTNFVKKNGGIGFLNVLPELVVTDDDDATLAKDNMPLVKDYLIMLFSEQDSSVLTNFTKLPQLRAKATAGLQALFKKTTGRTVVKDVLFSKYVWQ